MTMGRVTVPSATVWCSRRHAVISSLLARYAVSSRRDHFDADVIQLGFAGERVEEYGEPFSPRGFAEVVAAGDGEGVGRGDVLGRVARTQSSGQLHDGGQMRGDRGRFRIVEPPEGHEATVTTTGVDPVG